MADLKTLPPGSIWADPQAPWKPKELAPVGGFLPHPCLRVHPTHPSSGPGLYQPIVEGQRLHDGGVGLGAFLELLKRQLPVGILQEERWTIRQRHTDKRESGFSPHPGVCG